MEERVIETKLKLGIAAVVIIGMAGIFIWRPFGDTPQASERATDYEMNSNGEATNSAPTSLTKEEFKNLVVGKSMAEVRSALGKPSNVDESADGIIWFYWASELQVRDTDAGTTVNSSDIYFDPTTKVVIGVHF